MLSLHCKKVAKSFRQVFQTNSKTCFFCVIQYIDIQKQSLGSAVKVFVKSLKIAFDEVYLIANLVCQNLIRTNEDNLEHQVIHILYDF